MPIYFRHVKLHPLTNNAQKERKGMNHLLLLKAEMSGNLYDGSRSSGFLIKLSFNSGFLVIAGENIGLPYPN
jgi:hypothetical protein